MNDDELKRLKDQISEEIMRGKGMTTARVLRRHKGMSVETAKEVAEKTAFMEWRRIVGPKGGRPTIVFFWRMHYGRILQEEDVPWLLEQIKSRQK